ncbi:MAG: hypothetical protein ABIM89_15640 [Mycobacteriales bacterium]
MLLSRRVSSLLIAIALFQYFAWLTFARNLANTSEHRSTAYYVVHTVLIVANLVIATFIGYLGARGLKGMDEVAMRKYFDDRELDGVPRY